MIWALLFLSVGLLLLLCLRHPTPPSGCRGKPVKLDPGQSIRPPQGGTGVVRPPHTIHVFHWPWFTFGGEKDRHLTPTLPPAGWHRPPVAPPASAAYLEARARQALLVRC